MNCNSRSCDWRQPGKACPSPINTLKIVCMKKKIRKVVFRTQYDESVLDGTFERFEGASMTEPDNSMSIPEIIAKYTRGQGIHVRQNPWTVGEAPEDGYEVGDGVDPEGFLLHGLQEPVPQEPQVSQEPQVTQELQVTQEPKVSEPSTE